VSSFDSRWVSVLGAQGRSWSVRIKAKLDTGAKRCSIDLGLASALGLEQVGERAVRNAMGRQVRPLYAARVRVGRRIYDVEMTGADRTGLRCPMLIGKELLDRIDDVPLKRDKDSGYPVFH